MIVDSAIVDFANFRYLSPQNIDRLTVLKDAETTALYGSRAVNGVIIVDMKKSFRFLSIDDILRAHKADSIIGKSMIVTINEGIVSNIKALKVDASIIQSVQVAKMMNAGGGSAYNVTIHIKPTAAATSRGSIMIRGDGTSI
ncbi:TonB-dependent receptor plug domain-containing protein [Niabella defluvii]|nr:TonB-dependent receptor plug domain-containing protein [Niabella sp. I65]